MKNVDFVRIYGDEDSGVWVGPRGAVVPTTTLEEPPEQFGEVGWLSEEGITESPNETSETFRAYQGAKVVRRKITASDTTFSFQAIEENAVVHGLKYRGAESETTGGVTVTTVADQTRADTRSWIFDMLDGDVWKRYIVPAGDYTRTGTVAHQNASLTTYEFEVTPIGDWFEVTNNPALAAD